MNLATKRTLEAIKAGQFQRAADIIREYGHRIGTSAGSVEFWALGDDVICWKSVSQVTFAGYQSKAPYFKPPQHMEAAA